MSNVWGKILASSFAIALGTVAISSYSQSPSSTSESTRKPVLVELFTSEGCSDCPPADTLLQKLDALQPVHDAEIIPIEEHVDYWNQGGWYDPYSSHDWTARQMTYTPETDKTGPYTPEMIVDGAARFVGSDPRKAISSIETAAARPETQITITPDGPAQKSSRDFTVSVGKLAGDTPGDVAEVWLAVTEDGLHSSVNRGENAGRSLTHIATLRSMHKIGDIKSDSETAPFTDHQRVKFDSHWNAANLHLIVFVQERKSHQVIGVTSVKLAS
jgi:hypothetical protein